ncbi:hypothetical protein JHK82_050938 [Glycine max]|nr:hypothetical protein JHK82_050938 [Glycine max]KAG5095242.1 hypothetical protein JHK84_050830 [Glycine max]
MQLLDGYNSVALDLDQSRARVNPLEELVRKIEFGLIINKCNSSLSLADDGNMELKAEQHAVTFAIGLPCEGEMELVLNYHQGIKAFLLRPKDITRKLLSGDLDLGIVGLDSFTEHGQIPQYGIFENVNSVDELAKMPQWTEEKPLRVAIGFTYMGMADAILDIVSSVTTLTENNLKEIKGRVTTNMRGSSAEEVAERILSQPSLMGLQGRL